jgi:thiol-disulfide isomerase/thioredoxin
VSRLTRALLLTGAAVAIIVGFRAGAGPDSQLRAPERRNALSPFRLASIGGPAWALADQRGSVVLLNFWATWCPPCRKETPDLVTLAHTYGSRGLRVAGITMDDDPASVVPAFIDRYHVPYPMLIPDESLSVASAVRALPTTLLLDRQGRVARLFRGAHSAEEMAVDIERLLGEKP